MAVKNEKNARPQIVESGKNKSANKIPNCAQEMVAPVVGEINLFIHNCCMIKPATLIPMPVQRIANKRGKREIINIFHASIFPVNKLFKSKSITPTNSETKDAPKRMSASIIVD